MQMCARCHKRIAVVYISHMDPERNEMVNEGLCIQCARELGIKPVNDMLEKMGVSQEDIDRMSEDLNNAIESATAGGDDTGEDAGAPAIDLPKLFGQLGINITGQQQSGDATERETPTDAPRENKEKKAKKPDPRRKTLDTFCTNLTRRAAEGKIDRIVGR